jgi:hypothetical protein
MLKTWRTEVRLSQKWPTLSAIVLQSILTVARSDVYSCAGCGYLYVRGDAHSRRPRPNQNNYCHNCGVPRARLDAKRRYRQKIAEARKLYASGVPIGRIAEQLDTETENEKWLGVEDHGKKTR